MGGRRERDGFTPKISLGQNFILDPALQDALVADAQVGPESQVLEIGAGSGTLTRALAQRARRVLALEIDGRLESVLRENLADTPNVELVMADAMETDLGALCRERLPGPFQVVANLPYYITTPLLTRLLFLDPRPASISVMVQKEVGEKMMAPPGGKAYGPLAVFCAHAAQVTRKRLVPASAFSPPPQVDSAFMHLALYPDQTPEDGKERLFRRVVRGCFAMRRKTVANNLQSAFQLSRPEALSCLEGAGIAPTARAESLPLSAFAALTQELTKKNLAQ